MVSMSMDTSNFMGDLMICEFTSNDEFGSFFISTIKRSTTAAAKKEGSTPSRIPLSFIIWQRALQISIWGDESRTFLAIRGTICSGSTRPISRLRESAIVFEYLLIVFISIPVDACISFNVLEQACIRHAKYIAVTARGRLAKDLDDSLIALCTIVSARSSTSLFKCNNDDTSRTWRITVLILFSFFSSTNFVVRCNCSIKLLLSLLSKFLDKFFLASLLLLSSLSKKILLLLSLSSLLL